VREGREAWHGETCADCCKASLCETKADYNAILARMCLVLADKDPIEVSIEDLRDVIDTWSTRTAPTRQKVTSVVRAFWKWAEEQGHIAVSPASRIRRPRVESRVSQVLPLDARPRLLSATKHPRDRVRPLLPSRPWIAPF
jgi:site-specific recombinase XerD